MAQTVIGKAKELIEEVGTEKAIAFFQKRIDDIGEPKNFQDICNISGNETAIDFIKGNIK
tara:strand:+ start:57 stop:236 length:180 start_codon:yes stop_codon:yes gene_type:complete